MEYQHKRGTPKSRIRNKMETLKVKAFGMVAEKLPEQEFAFPPQTDTAAFLANLYLEYPELKDIKFSLAVDRKLVNEKTALQGGEEIALLPPFSGG